MRTFDMKAGLQMPGPGLLAERLGYSGLFGVGTVISLVTPALLAKVERR